MLISCIYVYCAGIDIVHHVTTIDGNTFKWHNLDILANWIVIYTSKIKKNIEGFRIDARQNIGNEKLFFS